MSEDFCDSYLVNKVHLFEGDYFSCSPGPLQHFLGYLSMSGLFSFCKQVLFIRSLHNSFQFCSLLGILFPAREKEKFRFLILLHGNISSLVALTQMPSSEDLLYFDYWKEGDMLFSEFSQLFPQLIHVFFFGGVAIDSVFLFEQIGDVSFF